MSDLSYLVAKHRQDKFDYYKNQEEMQTRRRIIEELEKIKGEIKEYGSIWVQYSIKGHTDKDIDDIVDDVLKQAKQSFIRRLDKHISELKGENK